MKSIIACLGCTITLSACVAPVINTEQTVDLAVVNRETLMLIPSATCQVIDDRGTTSQIKTNPGGITLGGDHESLSITCKAPGYTQKVIGVTQSTNSWALDSVTYLPNFNVLLTGGKFPSHVIIFMTTQADPSTQKVDHAFNLATKNELFFQGQQAK